MADPLSIAASALTVAATVQTIISLRDTVKRYKGRDTLLARLQNTLQDLINVLINLDEIIDKDKSPMLKHLKGPVDRCREVCDEFKKAMEIFGQKSATRRDWMRMEFMKGDINAFIDTLAGYKSTIAISLGAINMHASRITQEVLEEYHEMIMTTIYNLELRLERIDENISSHAADNATGTYADVDLGDERQVTEQCILVCKDAQLYIESLRDQAPSLGQGESQTVADTAKSRFEAQHDTHQALEEARETFSVTIGRLQERLDSLELRGEPQSSVERRQLQADLDAQKKCLQLCKQAAQDVSYRKMHTFGEITADDDSYGVVVTTLADLFDVKKVTSKKGSSLFVGSFSDAALMQLSADHREGRYAAHPRDRERSYVDVTSTRSNPEPPYGRASPHDQEMKDQQPETKIEKPNSVRKRASEGGKGVRWRTE